LVEEKDSNAKCTEFDEQNPFAATGRLLRAIEKLHVRKEEANFLVVPFHQACTYALGLFDMLAKTEASSLTQPHSFVWIMVHDWSRCFDFHWGIVSKRRAKKDRSIFLGEESVFSTNGDTNTNCFSPTKDVVIPPM